MQANIYLDYEGIKGEATAEQYKDLITVDYLSLGVNREISSYTGTSMDREASATRMKNLTIQKLQDKASADLFKEATIGKGKKAVFYITKQGEEIEEIVKIELKDAMIAGYDLTADGDRPSEKLTISYTELTLTVTPTDDTNKATAPLVYGFSSATGKRL